MRLDLPEGAALPDLVRGTVGNAGSLEIVIAGGGPPVALAAACAVIAPLAIEVAPGMRLNAVLSGPGAAPRDVAAAVGFLERATSTTGQLIVVSPR